MACPRAGIFTLVTFVSRPLAMISIHHFPQFDPSFFDASIQLTKKREKKRNLNNKYSKTFALSFSWCKHVQLSNIKQSTMEIISIC